MDEADARLGSRLGNYVLREIVGRGGMGVVYRAEHVYIGKSVAVKVLSKQYFDQPNARERFLKEARAAGVIEHPNIIGVTDFGEASDGTVFLVMAHVPGASLDRVLRTEGRLPLFRTLVILHQVTRGLSAAHGKGIIHHDLKPENIMLDARPGRREIVREIIDDRGTLELVEPEGSFDFVTVLDFGAAKFFGDSPSSSGGVAGTVVGTPAYMAPETARIGVADERSDIYAVGIILYEMLTGFVPFDGTDATDIMIKHVEAPVPPPRDLCPEAEITADAEHAIYKALDKDPARRYQNMDEFSADLQRCYGSVRFRRSVRVLPPGVNVASLRKPVPLTQVKKRPADAAGADGAASATNPALPEAPPADRTPTPAPTTPAPLLLLTRRKSGRHRTLPFIPAFPDSEPGDAGGLDRGRRSSFDATAPPPRATLGKDEK